MPTVAALTPANGATGILANAPAVCELTAAASADLHVTETLDTDFAAGTLSGVATPPTGQLELARSLVDDFESYATGSLPAAWSAFDGTAVATVESFGGSNVLQVVATGAQTGTSVKWLTPGTLADRDVTVKVRCTAVAGRGLYALARITGDTTYYHVGIEEGTTVYLRKRVAGTFTTLGSAAFTWVADTWYYLRIQVVGSSIKAKVWAASGAEPAAWTLTATDGDITAAGHAGVRGSYTTGSTWYFESFTLAGEAAAYAASGYRESPTTSLTPVGTAGSATIEWDEVVPAGTTVTVSTQFNSAGWVAATNGGPINGIAEGDDLTGDTVQTKIAFTTSNTAVTPAVTELRLHFRGVNPALVTLTVNGVDYTVANGGLEVWNDQAVSGSAVVEDHRDVFFRTVGARWYDGEADAVDVEVSYDGASLQTNTFTTHFQEGYHASFQGYWTSWETSPEWRNTEADGYFYVIDLALSLVSADGYWICAEPLGGQMDGYFWVAHPIRLEGVSAGIVGVPTRTEGPSAGVVEGWARTEGPSAGIVQGYIRLEGPAAGVVGIPTRTEGPAAGVVGIPTRTEGPSAGVVYQVNRHNTLELDVMSEDTAAILAALGITVA